MYRNVILSSFFKKAPLTELYRRKAMAPPTDSPQASLVHPSFRLNSKAPLLDRPPPAVARLLETLDAAVAAAADHPWLKPLLSLSTEIRTFFAEVI